MRAKVGKRWWWLAIVLVGVMGAAFVWWGKPRLGEGSLAGPGEGMAWAGDVMVVRGSPETVRATFSIRNDGSLPFTVYGLDVTEMVDSLARQQVTFVPGLTGTATPVKQVTLSAGEEATVLWSLDLACWSGTSVSASLGIETLRFKVRWLGIGTTRELTPRRPMEFSGGGC